MPHAENGKSENGRNAGQESYKDLLNLWKNRKFPKINKFFFQNCRFLANFFIPLIKFLVKKNYLMGNSIFFYELYFRG